MTIWWLMTVPVGFAALMLFFAWASHTGRLPRWGQAMSRWSERHPILVFSAFLAPSIIWLAGAAFYYTTGRAWLAALWAFQAVLMGFHGWTWARRR